MMRTLRRRWIPIGAVTGLSLAAIPMVFWFSLRHEPDFYRRATQVPVEHQKQDARRFVAQSLQLRNDIINESRWEALFSDEEVNAWLAEDLVKNFADQLPPGVHDPRFEFEPDRAILAFRLEDPPIRSVIWVVLRVRVPEPNVVALTVEKVRAGVMPVPADQILERIAEHARLRGIDVRWERDGPSPVAMIRYQANMSRRDISLEQVQISQGRIRLSGRSERQGETARLELPSGRLLQATFPKNRRVQPVSRSAERPGSPRTRSSSPTS